jgi:hypothetical protein
LAKDIHYVRGVAHWAKVIGEPKKNNFDDYREWTIDVSMEDEDIKLFKKLGVADRVKDPKSGDDRGPFYTFKQREFRADGTKNDPIRIVDAKNQPWPEGKLIGNGSIVEVKFKFQPADGRKKAGIYIRAIRVLKLVEYKSSEFAPLKEDDEYFAADDAATPDFHQDFGIERDDLDDDIPE